MDNPETLATLDTQDQGRSQTKHKNTTQKTKTISNTDPTKNRGEFRCLRGSAVPKTPPCYLYSQQTY